MYDGLNSDAAAIKKRFPNAPVAYYVNGHYTWSSQEIQMFGRHIAISVEPHLPEAANGARCLDVERYDATPADVKPFLVERAKYANNGTIYTSAANVRNVLDAAGNFDIPRWWIAWYWGRPGAPTAAQVQQAVRMNCGVSLPLSKIWACQYISRAEWDESAVYGKKDFAHS